MSAERTRLVLWRHGQTDWNVANRFQGQADVPLNVTGLAQARASAGVLRRLGVDAIVSSPLSRARTTADTLAELVGLPVAIDERLTEIGVGSWEGQIAEDIYRDHPEFASALAAGRDARRSPTGETATEVSIRMSAALREIAETHPGRTVVVASHGLAIRMGTAGVLGWDYETSTTLAGMRNCGWTMLAARPVGYWKLVSWNVVSDEELD